MVSEWPAACNRLSLLSSVLYHLVVNPCQLMPKREALKELTIRMTIGIYR